MHFHALVRFILTTKWYAFQCPDSDEWEIRTTESRPPEFPFGVLVMHTDMRELAEHLVYLHNRTLPK